MVTLQLQLTPTAGKLPPLTDKLPATTDQLAPIATIVEFHPINQYDQ